MQISIIRVPFFLHGPPSEVKKGIQILEPVMNIDLAPTFLDLAGIHVPDEMDGRSIVPLIKRYGPKPPESNVPFVWKDVFLIESSGRRDTHLPTTAPSVTPQPLKKSRKFRDEKRRPLQADNETIRINTLCQLHPHPCLPGQKKYCRKERDQNEQKIQLRKCRQSDFVEDPFMISPQVYDPLYQLISTNNDNNSTTFPEAESPGFPSKRCRCRYKRSDIDTELEEFDWDKERKIIDEEIELLKKRIDALRQRRRSMRRKWLVDNNLATDPSTTEPENATTSKPIHNARRGKGHNISQHKDKTGGQNNRIVTTSSTQPPTTTTLITTTTVTESEEEDDEDDEDEDLDDDDEEDDENDTSEDDEEEDDEDEPITTPTTTILPTSTPTTTTTTTTTSTTTTPTTTTKNSQVFGKVNTNFIPSHNKSNHGTFQQRTRPMMGPNNKKRKQELGLDFEGDFELDSFVRHKHRNRNRHRNRHRPKFNNNGQLEPRSNINESDTNKEGTDGEAQICDCNNDPRWIRQREREDRKRKKLLSKFRKKQKYMKRIEDPVILKQVTKLIIFSL